MVKRRANRMPWGADIYLLLMLTALPIQRFTFPLNASLVEVLNAIALPFFWVFLIPRVRKVYFPYATAMWLILLGSLVGMLDSSIPWTNLAVILKDAYLYVWFITLIVIFSNLGANKLRHFMILWVIIAVLHGILILAQFLSPALLKATTAGVSEYEGVGSPRPLGMFVNANMAAAFQLVGFMPLFLAAPPMNVTLIVGLLLTLSIVATGSLGASVALLTGMMVGAVAIMTRTNKKLVRQLCFGVAMATLFCGGMYWLAGSQYPGYAERLDRMVFGRFERSAESRFARWEHGVDAISNMRLGGVGPGGVRESVTEKTLHNDFMAFSVERGVVGTVGLLVFGLLVIGKPVLALLKHGRHPPHARVIIICLAIIIAMLTESLTHEVYHFRFFWLVLALQVAMLRQIDCSERSQSAPPIS